MAHISQLKAATSSLTFKNLSIYYANQLAGPLIWTLRQRPNFMSTYQGLMPIQHNVLIDS